MHDFKNQRSDFVAGNGTNNGAMTPEANRWKCKRPNGAYLVLMKSTGDRRKRKRNHNEVWRLHRQIHGIIKYRRQSNIYRNAKVYKADWWEASSSYITVEIMSFSILVLKISVIFDKRLRFHLLVILNITFISTFHWDARASNRKHLNLF